MNRETIAVFAGGSGPRADCVAWIPAGAFVVAADSGADHALALGLAVDVAIGDFDSISPAALELLEQAGTRVERHPTAKDATDLELALETAVALRPRRIVVVGGADGRLDHLLGELLLLGSDPYADIELDALLGPATIHVVRHERLLEGAKDELISLFALHGPAVGVVTEGLAYPLRGETLAAGSTRGVSNLFGGTSARITLERGVLLAVRPRI